MVISFKIQDRFFPFLGRQIFIFFGLSLFVLNSFAQTDGDKKIQYKTNFFPLVYYTPETRIGIGIMSYTMLKINKLDSNCRTSNIQNYASYTQNDQFTIENEWRLFAHHERFVFSGTIDYTRFPELFFGIGNQSKVTESELYTFDLVKLQSKNLRQIKKNTFLGFQYDMQNLFNVKMKNKMMMHVEGVYGGDGYVTSGLGPLFVFDSRNNVLNASKGLYAEAMLSVNNKATLSHFNYNTLLLDLRKYQTIKKRYTLALNAYSCFNFGDVPFRAMPVIGGSRLMRGFYRGRFRDNNLIVLQLESRIHLYKRFGMVLFAGMGQVSKKVNNFTLDGFKYNYGYGIRYKINKKENINLRLDMGLTEEGHGLYIVFAESF